MIDELKHQTTLLLDTIILWPAKRSRGFTGEYVKPTTTTTHQDDIPAKPSSAATPTRHSPAGGRAHDVVSPIDTPRSQQDTKKCIQVGSATYAVTGVHSTVENLRQKKHKTGSKPKRSKASAGAWRPTVNQNAQRHQQEHGD